MVIKVLTDLSPTKLFIKIKEIEKYLGRKATKINTPRVCDIDILDYDKKCKKVVVEDFLMMPTTI